MRPVFRVQPTGQPTDYKTYSISAPKATHWRPATCEEVGCEPYAKGWTTRLPRTSPLVDLITSGSTGRRYRETTGLDTAEREFMFEPGQPCFEVSKHRVRLDRQERYLVRPGDWRATTGQPYVHTRAADWVEDFAEHQDKVARQVERGR